MPADPYMEIYYKTFALKDNKQLNNLSYLLCCSVQHSVSLKHSPYMS